SQRKTQKVTLLPCDIVDMPPRRQLFRARQHVVGTVYPDNGSGPSCGFHGEVPIATTDVGHVQWRQQVTEGSRPSRPASSRHELPRIPVRRLEVPLSDAKPLLHPRVVSAYGSIGSGRCEMRFEQRPERAVSVDARAVGDAVVHETGLAIFG